MAMIPITIKKAPDGTSTSDAPHGLICDPDQVAPNNQDVLRFTTEDDVEDVVLVVKCKAPGTNALDVFTVADGPAGSGVAFYIPTGRFVDITVRDPLGVDPAARAEFEFGIAPAAPVLEGWAGGDGQPTGGGG